MIRIVILAIAAAALLGCAAGRQYDYRNALVSVPLTGSGTLAIDVIDSRPYVVAGRKSPDFVGLSRGDFGVPYDVRTASGSPLAQDLEAAIGVAMGRRGFTVAGGAQPTRRKLRLEIHEWKTDDLMRMKVLYDLAIEVLDVEGALLARGEIRGEDVIGSGPFEHQESASAAAAFEVCFTNLLRNAEVQRALQGAD